MKAKLALLNISLILFIIGLFTSVSYGMKSGAAVILIAAFIIAVSYIYYLIKSIRINQWWSIDNLLITIAAGILAIIFIHGFSLSTDIYLLGIKPFFRYTFYIAGLLIIAVFSYAVIQSLETSVIKEYRKPLLALAIILSLLLLVGILSSLQIIPVSRMLMPYTLGFIFFFLMVLSIATMVKRKSINDHELWMISISSLLVITVMMIKYFTPELISNDLVRAIFLIGFIPAFILPLTLITIKRCRICVFTVLLFSILELYLIHAEPSWYYQLVYYGVDRAPDAPVEELLKVPSEDEIQEIRGEWKTKDLSPQQVNIEYQALKPNGDSIKVISHLVGGHKHYGMVRIPKNLDIKNAPVLVGLPGGGLHLDILGEDFLYNLGGEQCSPLLERFISIAPSYRGKILKGKDFCFLSGGAEGDAYVGAIEDAIAFLNVVKKMYNKDDRTRVLGYGVSKGAGIALMIGGLTDEFDYIIANSAFTNFLDPSVIMEGRIGGSFSTALYPSEATPELYRKKIITASPVYFSAYLPPFEVHHGASDRIIKVRHAEQLKQKMFALNQSDSTHNVYIFEGKGHGYFDQQKVFNSIKNFIEEIPSQH